jgi:hypothetical protein
MTRLDEQSPTTAGISPGASMLASLGLGGGRMRRRLAAGLMAMVIALAVLADVTPSEADNEAAIPAYAVRVAGGSFKQHGHWGVWVFGRRRVGRCWGTRTVEKGLPNETAYCGYEVPRQSQQLAARGAFPTDQGPKSLLFFLTRRNVALLKVLVDRPGGRRDLLRIHARAIGSRRAHQAHMQPTFGYGAGIFRGRLLCIRRVVAWTRSGIRVGAYRSGCGR